MDNKKTAIIIIILCALSLIVGIANNISPSPDKGETTVRSKNINSIFSYTGNKIALIVLEGAISAEHGTGLIGDLYSAESTHKALKRAIDDDSVKGVLLRVNSPGGTVAMSQEIYSTIMRLRAEKPVVVSMIDLAASGGYYIASAADRIYAQPGTLTGSIGVIFNTFNAASLLNNKLGISSNVIKSGKFKDTGSPYRAMSQDEKALLQNLIDQTYGQFLSAIEDGRIKRNDEYKTNKTELSSDNLKKYADGRIFSGEQAKSYGFIDELGGMYEAYEAVNTMAKDKFNIRTDEITMVQYNKPTGISNILFGIETIFNKKSSIESFLPLSVKKNHTLMYLWE